MQAEQSTPTTYVESLKISNGNVSALESTVTADSFASERVKELVSAIAKKDHKAVATWARNSITDRHWSAIFNKLCAFMKMIGMEAVEGGGGEVYLLDSQGNALKLEYDAAGLAEFEQIKESLLFGLALFDLRDSSLYS